jgi:hypothetical protein
MAIDTHETKDNAAKVITTIPPEVDAKEALFRSPPVETDGPRLDAVGSGG